MNDVSGVWQNFQNWYQQSFGPNGLVSFGFLPNIQDGNATIDEVQVSIQSMPTDYFAFGFLHDIPV